MPDFIDNNENIPPLIFCPMCHEEITEYQLQCYSHMWSCGTITYFAIDLAKQLKNNSSCPLCHRPVFDKGGIRYFRTLQSSSENATEEHMTESINPINDSAHTTERVTPNSRPKRKISRQRQIKHKKADRVLHEVTSELQE
ncbi:hypothetical protein RclHR1_01460002 [Rhizophagus clarus]|uniref:Uncharacterized protein n=1 Tax=Rhizophagus clarus TaxID=94130 RepID=A0A2Z6QHD1_9GLOM|nr:hypothetical protein RclHR1_01460002 [Rhizophagus clarus]GES74769.1 hypothetical protein RCL_jg10339.t1 [Rhizophagus clarus]